jgi:hypothetical protein
MTTASTDSTTPVVTVDTVIPKRERTPARAEFLSYILTTAVEGGINYWASVSDYRWWDPDLDGGKALHAEGLCNAYAVIHDQEGDRTGEHGTLVTVDDIARALGIIRQGPVEFLAADVRTAIIAHDRSNGEPEGSYMDIDAGIADEIVQVALFGKVVYG